MLIPTGSFLFIVEASQSRIASYSCPRGTRGRVQSLQFRRCFHHGRRSPAALAEQEYPEIQAVGHEPAAEPANAPRPRMAMADASPTKLDLRNRYTARRREIRHGISSRSEGFQEPPNIDLMELSYTEAWSALFAALRVGKPHAVLQALVQVASNNGMDSFNMTLKTMPSTSFSEILRCLDPIHFVGKAQKLHMEISPHAAKILRLPTDSGAGYFKICDLLLSRIKYVLAARRRSAPLCQADLRYLLRCAGATGNIMAAREIWISLTKKHGGPLEPDLMCYNHYLGVLCWSSPQDPLMRHSVRVIPYHLAPRAWRSPPPRLRGHRVGADGIKDEVSALFWNMIQAGIAGDEDTFCCMIIAFSREGDLAGIESILSRGWDINVTSLMESTKYNAAKNYSADSPLYPSNRLLHTIAHAYGTNNAIPTALRLIDYISRRYSITIETQVWEELMNWTYVLSMRRKPKVLEDGTVDDGFAMGQLPPEAVFNLWATVTSEPYNIRPTMQMFDLVISSLFHRQCFGQAQVLMEEAREHHKDIVKKLSVLLARSKHKSGTMLSWKLDRDIAFMHLLVRRNRQYIKTWVRRLLDRGGRSLKGIDWEARNVPKIMQRWKLFLPNRVEYKTSSGEVRFWTTVVNENRYRQWQYSIGIEEGKKRRMERRTGLTKSMESVTTGGRKGVVLRTRPRAKHYPSRVQAG